MAAQADAPNPLAPITTFDSLGEDAHAIIFAHLKFAHLKASRLVSKSWNLKICSQELLFARGILIHRSDETRTLLQNLTQILQLFRKNLVFTIPSIRFSNRVGPTIFAWLKKANMTNITSVEFDKCSLYIHQLLLLIRQMPNIHSLTMSKSKLMYPDGPNNGIRSPNFLKACGMEAGILNFGKLKKCDLTFSSLVHCDSFLELVFTKCDKMEDFRLSIVGSDDYRITSVYKALGVYMRKVRTTLKVLCLTVVPYRTVRAQGGLQSFDQFLEVVQVDNWLNFGMDALCELELEFPLTKFDLPRIHHILSPLLHSFRALKRFNLSTLSVATDQIEQVLGFVPATCKGEFTAAQRIEDLENQHPINPFRRGSFVEIKGKNWEVALYYSTWAQAFEKVIVLDQLPHLTNLYISNGWFNPDQIFHVTDEFFQQILERGVNLMELRLLQCRLEHITDFGITGLSAEACQRMSNSQNYTIEPGDRTGHDLSNLTKLHTIKIHGLTNSGITDITARFAFRGNPKLRWLEIWTSNTAFSPHALFSLRETFIHNQVVKIITEAPRVPAAAAPILVNHPIVPPTQ